MGKRSNYKIEKNENKCLNDCTLYSRDDIVKGLCPFTKYSRSKRSTLEYTKHEFANNYHYHYSCVLEKVGADMKEKIIASNDVSALKTHYPYYQGLEMLIKI